MRYFLKLSYKGTNYCGWQIQKNAPSIQETINKYLSEILSEEIYVTGCGRTDTGVHASKFYAHFDVSEKLRDGFLLSLNQILPNDIAISSIIEVEDDAHSRFDAIHREYVYHLHGVKDPFLEDFSFYYHRFGQLNREAIEEASSAILQFGDFYSLCKFSDNPSTICQMLLADWEWDDESKRAVFTIRANRFLRGMVRLSVGALLRIGEGKLTVDEFVSTLRSRERFKYNFAVPPQGLFLMDIKYPYF